MSINDENERDELKDMAREIVGIADMPGLTHITGHASELNPGFDLFTFQASWLDNFAPLTTHLHNATAGFGIVDFELAHDGRLVSDGIRLADSSSIIIKAIELARSGGLAYEPARLADSNSTVMKALQLAHDGRLVSDGIRLADSSSIIMKAIELARTGSLADDAARFAHNYKFGTGLLDAEGNHLAKEAQPLRSFENLEPSLKEDLANRLEESLSEMPAEAAPEPLLLVSKKQRVQLLDYRLQALVNAIVVNPQLRFDLHWRDFERIVAQLLAAEGYEDVQLGPGSKDGGVDVLATHKTPFGQIFVAAQCKRYKEGRSVPPDDVRSLWGVVTDERFGQGILVTTSTFQPMARAFAEKQNGMIALADGGDFARRIKRLRAS